MIFDTLDHAARYAGLGEPFSAVLDFLRQTDLDSLPDGKVELRGSDLYVMVKRYRTRPVEEGVWEAHRKYVDVQVMVKGREIIEFASLDTMQVGEFNEAKDLVALNGAGNALTMFPGAFTVFFPEDAHKPELAEKAPDAAFKLVFKIAVSTLTT